MFGSEYYIPICDKKYGRTMFALRNYVPKWGQALSRISLTVKSHMKSALEL